MIDDKLIIEVGGQQVLSELAFDLSHPHRTMVWITSTCGEHNNRKSVNIGHRIGYTQAQLEHDIEEARWAFAEEVAGKASVRSLLKATVQPVTGSPVTVTSKVALAPSG